MKGILKIASVSVGLLSVGISFCMLRASGQTGSGAGQAPDSKDQARLAVNIIRVINTAQVVSCRTQGGEIDPKEKFLTWNELLKAQCFRQAQSHFSGARFAQVSDLSFSSGHEIVPGLELRLVVSSDGSHYHLWLGQKQEVQCGFAFYSDERGVIYEGKAIGCDPQGILGKP